MKKPFIAAGLLGLLALTGCTPDKHITEVKALPFSYPSENVQDPNLTVDQALDYRKVCDSAKWKVDQTDQHQTFVEYQCDYKDVEHSALVANAVLKAKVERGDKANGKAIVHVVHAGDVYQWVYGPNGSPALSYVAMRLHYSNGTSKDILTQSWDATHLMQAAAENKANDYDHIYAAAANTQIPPMPTAATEAYLQKMYDEAHPHKVSSEELLQLFSPQVIGMSVAQYEKMAGQPKEIKGENNSTEARQYFVKGCFLTVKDTGGTIDAVTATLGKITTLPDGSAPMDGHCPVTDANVPPSLQGRHLDWSALTQKDVDALARTTTSNQTLNCLTYAYGGFKPNPVCEIFAGDYVATTIQGNQADGSIDTAFNASVEVHLDKLTDISRRHHVEVDQLTPEIYNNDADFKKEIIGQTADEMIGSLTLQRGGLSGRNPDVQLSPSMASTTAPPPAPQLAQAAQSTPANPVTPQVVNSAVAALTGASQPQGQAAANASVHSGDVGPDGWPKMTPCILKLQDKFTADQQKQNADTSTSLEQMQEWADVCKSLGQ